MYNLCTNFMNFWEIFKTFSKYLLRTKVISSVEVLLLVISNLKVVALGMAANPKKYSENWLFNFRLKNVKSYLQSNPHLYPQIILCRR